MPIDWLCEVLMKYLVVLFLVLSACAKEQSQSVQASSDPLRSSMTWSTSEPWWAIDLNPSLVGDQIIHWVLAFDQECESAVQLDGNGNMKVAFSTQLSKTQGSDISCSMFDGTWTYQVLGQHLTICQTGGPCVVF